MATIIEKIHKLLAKAEGTDNEHEADAFMAKAQALMVEYQVSDEQIRLQGEKPKEEIITKNVPFGMMIGRDDKVRLLCRIAKTMQARAFHSAPWRKYDYVETTLPSGRTYRKRGKGKMTGGSVTVVGYASDIDVVYALWTHLCLQADLAVAEAVKNKQNVIVCQDCGGDGELEDWHGKWKPCEECKGTGEIKIHGRTFRANFMDGFVSEAGNKVFKTYGKAKTDAEASAPGTALVLSDRGKRVSDYVDQMFDLKSGSASGRSCSGASASAGRSAGAKADVSMGRGRVHGGGKQLGK